MYKKNEIPNIINQENKTISTSDIYTIVIDHKSTGFTKYWKGDIQADLEFIFSPKENKIHIKETYIFENEITTKNVPVWERNKIIYGNDSMEKSL